MASCANVQLPRQLAQLGGGRRRHAELCVAYDCYNLSKLIILILIIVINNANGIAVTTMLITATWV